MLKSSPFKANDIICFRITTGEEIVAKLKIEDSHTYSVTRPLALVNGPKGVMMVPAMVTVDHQTAEIVYNKTAVISVSSPTKQITDSYLTTTSGLVSGKGINPDKLKSPIIQ